jgi:hypothetical protein
MKTKYTIASLLAIALLFGGCNNYRKISYSKVDVFKKKPVKEKIDRYDIYVHQDETTYRVENPEVSESGLSGTPVEVTEEEMISGDSLNDMHIFMNDGLTIESEPNEVQNFTEENVDNVEMYGAENSGIGKAFLIVLGVLLLLFIILIIALIVGLSNSGGSTSGGSDSGGSDSGGSDSGGSDSGGSGSGCYIATMSFGSYNAPQVMVLREFRDRFLDKFGAGRMFIAWYYKNSPGFVEKHRSKKWLHSLIRVPLTGLVVFLRLFYSGDRAKN